MPFGFQQKQKQGCLDLSEARKGGTTQAVMRHTVPNSTGSTLREATNGIYRERDGSPCCDLPSTSGRELEVEFPLRLRLAGTKAGRPDLQLQLIEFAYGADVQRKQPPLLFKWPEPLQGISSVAERVGSVAERAATLAFLRLAFPDQFPTVQKWLVRAGAVSAVGALAQEAGSRAERGRGSRPQPLHGRKRSAWQRLWAKKQEWQHKLPQSLKEDLEPTLRAVGRRTFGFAKPAVLLATVAMLWRKLHPDSHQLVQAIIVAIELSSGYAQTQRNAALGYIQSGPQLEAAWRARHKWAAQRAGRVLTDVYDSPPLQPLMTAAQKLSIGLVLLANGAQGAAGLPAGMGATGIGSAWGAGSSASSWMLTASIPAGRRDLGDLAELPSTATQQRSIQAVGGAAPVTTGSAEQVTPVQPALQSARSAWLMSTLQAGGTREASAGTEVATSSNLQRFEPLPTEDLVTGGLPTICSLAEMEEYRLKQAAGGSAAAPPEEPGHSPFEIAANATQEAQEVEEQAGPRELIVFNTDELIAMDPGIRAPGGQNQSDELVPGSNLALYGRGDHLQEAPLTLVERQQMVLRGAFLLAVFLPFLILGPLLLLLSRSSGPKRPQAAVTVTKRPAASQPDTPMVITEHTAELIGEAVGEPEEASWGARETAWRLLLWGIRNSGAAFIKWGQWSATREDMFPVELCRVLSELHDRAPLHSWAASKREIEAAFGKPVEELFESIEHEPMASGSIAQVHRAVMVVGGKRRSMAVKVRHPGVETQIRQDFKLLKPLAAGASKFKALKGLSLKESLAQFSSTMTAQTDLRVEAAHLRRFFRNFVPVRGSVTPPFPLPQFISESVLIETFEPGESVAKYIRNPAPFNTQIVALGVDTYLKMLLTDNFVHTDLHPGNILVRKSDGSVLSAGAAAEAVRGQLQLILLDFGLAEELTPSVRRHFISFLHMIAAGNGRRAAYHILRWSSDQQCPDPAGFTTDMIELFHRECNIHTPHGIELDMVMKSVLRLARQHEVSIDSSYAALVIGVVVLVGFATSMDPAVNLMDAAAPAFLQHNLLGKISGRLYS